MSTKNDKYFSLRRKAIKHLTTLIHLPTPFLSAFLAVHLSAPLMANIGGGELSSQVMLLGREYYQRSPTTSAILVYVPVAMHVLSADLKRILTGPPRFNFKNPTFPRSRTLLSISAYLTAILLPTHVFVSRFSPTLSDAPTLSLGPGELDYEFVKYGLRIWPGRSGILLGGLVCAVCVHAYEGWKVVLARWVGNSKRSPSEQASDGAATNKEDESTEKESHVPSQPSIIRHLLPAIIPAALVLSGVLTLYFEEPQGSAVLSSAQARFDAIYRKASWWFW